MSPPRLFDLFLRPHRFFSEDHATGGRVALVTAALLYGLGVGVGRLERQAAVRFVLKARGIVPRRPAYFLGSIAVDWHRFWGHAALSAIVAGAIFWTVGAWWFRLRARWCGAPEAELGTSREIYIWSGLVLALPALILTLVQTAVFPSFRAAWMEASLWTIALIVFPFWSTYTSYAGARARFPVVPGRAVIWFLVLPWLLYAVAFAGLGASILHMQQRHATAGSMSTSGNSI